MHMPRIVRHDAKSCWVAGRVANPMRVSRLVTRTSADLDLNSELYSLRVGAAVAFASCLQLSQPAANNDDMYRV